MSSALVSTSCRPFEVRADGIPSSLVAIRICSASIYCHHEVELVVSLSLSGIHIPKHAELGVLQGCAAWQGSALARGRRRSVLGLPSEP